MRKIAISLLMLPLLSASTVVLAAGQMKPGLWEMTMKSDAFKNMPKIPSEQMEQMRKMGVTVPNMQNGGIVQKVCITRQMVERDGTPQMLQAESGCESKNFKTSGNSYSGDIARSKRRGQGKGHFLGE